MLKSSLALHVEKFYSKEQGGVWAATKQDFDYKSLLQYDKIVICGPTASGKTGLYEAIESGLAKLGHKVEAINADTGQMYRELKIGTAKPELNERLHCFDVLSLGERTSAAQFAKLCGEAEAQIKARQALPIIVGGSFFYIQSLFFPLFQQESASSEFLLLEPGTDLYAQLFEIDPVRAREIGPNDHYRLSRALNIWNSTETLPSTLKPVFLCADKVLLIVIDQGQVELDRRIKLRLDLMLQGGWIEEVAALSADNQVLLRETNGLIGYREVLQLVNNELSLEKCKELIFYKTRNYAKRQRKFFASLEKKIRKDNSAKNLKIVKLHHCSLSSCVEI